MSKEPEDVEFFEPVEITAGNYIYLKQESHGPDSGLLVMTRAQARRLSLDLITAVGLDESETPQ